MSDRIVSKPSIMKLYIWADPYSVQYGSSMLLAVASSLEEAKQIAITAPGYRYWEHGCEGGGSTPLGDPTRIVDIPCAEWHEWSE